MPLVMRWVTDDVGLDDGAGVLVERAVCGRWRESEEFMSSCRKIGTGQDRVVMKGIAGKRGVLVCRKRECKSAKTALFLSLRKPRPGVAAPDDCGGSRAPMARGGQRRAASNGQQRERPGTSLRAICKKAFVP